MSVLTHSGYKEFWGEKSLHAGLAAIAAWRKRAQERAELAQLSERDARDLGLSASQIQFEASKPFWRA